MVNNDSKVSVIVPVFNSEAYVEKCIRSVLNQSYKNLELIVVDDGSTDNTSNIVNSIFIPDDRKTKYIPIERGGVSHARNIGLSAATGDYIIFLDSDDYLEENILMDIFEKFQRFDVCLYGFDQTYHIDETPYYLYEDYFSYFNCELSGLDVALLKLKSKLWICQGNALYNRNLIEKNNVYYDEALRHGEDALWIYQFLLLAQKVVCLPKIGLHILDRSNSVGNQNFNKSMFDIYKSKEQMMKSTSKLADNEKQKFELLQYLRKEYIFVPINLSKRIIKGYSVFNIKKAIKKINNLKIPNVKNKGIFDRTSTVSSKVEKYEYRLFNFSKYIFFITVKFYYFIRKGKR